ncbi:MAG TPA: photosynthetic complex assembly protein PuhC [Vineibacter sp.]|nr:photosynthetic complex assembly protein PuhC [Vineibacter sp.]
MSHTHAETPIPRGVLIGAAVLVAMSIALAGTARITGIGTTRMPPASLVESRELRFADRQDGSIAVFDAANGETVAVVAPGTNGFLRGALRGLARERKRQDIGAGPAFRLVRWADGRLTLEDPTTTRVVDLAAFGTTNAAVFAELLTAGNSQR